MELPAVNPISRITPITPNTSDIQSELSTKNETGELLTIGITISERTEAAEGNEFTVSLLDLESNNPSFIGNRADPILPSLESLQFTDESLDQLISANRTEAIDALLTKNPLNKFNQVSDFLDVTLKILAKYIVNPVRDMNTIEGAYIPEMPPIVNEVFSEAAEHLEHVRLGHDVVTYPFDALELFLRGSYLKAAKEELASIDQNGSHPEEYQKKIISLKWFIEEQENRIRDLGIRISIKSLSFVPYVTEGIATLAKIPLPPALDPILGSCAPVIQVIKSGLALHKARKAVILHEEWVNNPKFQDPLGAIPAPVQQDSPNSPLQTLSDTTPETYAKELYLKRKETFEKRKLEKEDSFNQLMKKLIQTPTEEKKSLLRENGIRLEMAIEKWNSLNPGKTFEESVFLDEAFRNILFNQYIEHEETISISARNGIKVLSGLKPIIEKKFFSFNLNKERILFAITVLAATTAIVLQVLAWSSVIAIPMAANAVPGLGVALAGIMLFSIGLYLFYRYKPNVFKTMARGVQLQLAYEQLKNWIKEIQVEKKRTQQAAEAVKTDALIIKKENVKRTSRKEQLDKEIKVLDAKIAKNKERIEALRARMRNAAAFDFAKNIGIETMKQTEVAEKSHPENMDIFKIVADGIIEGNWAFDPQTEEILEKRMGIPIRELDKEKDKTVLKEELHKALKDYFGMDTSQLINFFKKQNFQYNL